MRSAFRKKDADHKPVFSLSEGVKDLNGGDKNAIRALVKKIVEDSEVENPVVALTTGSYNPTHTEHINLMLKAITAMELHGCNVVAVVFSPSHDSYVVRKLGKDRALDGAFRYELLKKTVDDVVSQIGIDPELCMVDSWELQQERFCDHPIVIKKLREYLQPNVKIWYVCGSDLYAKCCGLCRGHSADGIAIVERGVSLRGTALDQYKSNPNHILIESVEDKSSTAIREAGNNFEALGKLMSPSALKCYMKHAAVSNALPLSEEENTNITV